MVLSGNFNIVCPDCNNVPVNELEAFCVNNKTGEETLLEYTDNGFSYQFESGDKKNIKIVNKSGTFRFYKNDNGSQELLFPVMAGKYSIYTYNSAEPAGKVRKVAVFSIVDYLGRNLLLKEYNYLIANLSLNDKEIPDNILQSGVKDNLKVLLNPFAQNYVSFSWINTNGYWIKEKFLIFPGNQILTVK